MPYQFDFDSNHRILRCQFEGRVTNEEFAQHLPTTWQHVARLDPRGGITDLSLITSWEVTLEKLRALARVQPLVRLMGRPIVMLATSDHIFGLARMFEVESENTRRNLHVVRTWKEAGAILGVQEFHFEPIPAEAAG